MPRRKKVAIDQIVENNESTAVSDLNKSNDYNADSIKVLSDIQHIRLRKGMYVGEADNPRSLINEMMDNAIDEVQSGHSSELVVSVDTAKNEYTVRDYGRGIPIAMKKLDDGTEMETLEVICTKSNSGGKFDNSSYTKSCFTGDTKIKLADNRDITIDELITEFESGKDNFTYSIDNETKRVVIEKIRDVRVARNVTELAVVTLDNGEVIKCTPDHRFLMRDYTLIEARDLKYGDSLLPGYFKLSNALDSKSAVDYNMIYDHSIGKYYFCHYLADEYNIRYGNYKLNIDKLKEYRKNVRHHIDFHKLNNNPNNIIRCSWKEHQHMHPGATQMMRICGYTDEQIHEIYSKSRSKASKAAWDRLSKEEKIEWLRKSIHSPSAKAKVRAEARRTITKYNKSKKGRETSRRNGLKYGTVNFYNYMNSEKGRKTHSDLMTNMNKDPEIQKKQQEWMHTELGQQLMRDRINERNNDPECQKYMALCRGLKLLRKMYDEGFEISEESYMDYRKKDRKYNGTPRFEKIISNYNSIEDLIEAVVNYNHKVISVEIVKVPITPVYDVTICESASNFLLSAGVFVKNCGLNGLGLTVTNALSAEFSVMTFRDGHTVEFISEYGNKVLLNYSATNEHNGTRVKFVPDKDMFRSPIIPVQYIQNRCRIMSAFGYRARLIVDEEELDTNSTIYDLMHEDETDSISDYWRIPEVSVATSNEEEMKVAIKYTSSTTDKYYGYTNLLYNSLGGTHVSEISKTIISAWNEFIDGHKKLRPAVDLRNSDYLIGARVVCAVFIMKPEFSSQTKDKLVVDKKYFKELMDKFKSEFIKVLEDNIVLAQSLIKRFEEYRIVQNKLLARKEISSLIKINTDSADNIRRRSIVSKLVECTSKKREGTELFIVEGNSAQGPYLATRNKETQAVLPLRGKILNVTYKDVKNAVKNAEICDIANSLGAGIGSNCDASKSRYERVIISGDADADGLQINCLVLSVFINMFPDMVKQGRVFISMPPLYCWNVKGSYGWTNDANKIPSNTKVVRFKGLGEMNNDELKYFLVDPETRNLMKVEYPTDVDKFNSILGTAKGKHDLMVELGIIEES